MTDLAAFEFGLPTSLTFGPGTSSRLADICKQLSAKSAFVVLDPGLEKAGTAEPILRTLETGRIRCSIFTQIQPNPVDLDIEAGAVAYSTASADVIIGIGGGSALDTAKGVAMLAANGGRVRDYSGNDRVPADSLPVICVPTTAGTGSEVSGNISVTNSETHEKMAVRSPRIFARRAVLDPTLLHSLPASVAAAAGMDALVHAIESYTSTRASAFTRMLSLDAAGRIARSLPGFVADRTDSALAMEMQYGSSLAGMPLYFTGTGAVHAVARALGGHYNVPHGVACAVLLDPVMRFNLDAAEQQYAQLAEAMGVGNATTTRRKAEAVLSRSQELRESVGIPSTLTVEVPPELRDRIADWASENSGPNPRPVTAADARQFLSEILPADSRT